jgi:hypothetical protein
MITIGMVEKSFKQAGLEPFYFDLNERYNEDYKYEVPGVLIKHIWRSDFCIFIANLNNSDMRRPIDPDKMATVTSSNVIGVWTPNAHPQWQDEWINECEFSADDIFNDNESAIKSVILFVSKRVDGIK